MVGILILIHANVAEALLILLQHIGVIAQKLQGAHQQVVKVHSIRRTQTTLQLKVYASGLFFLRTRSAPQHVLRPNHGVFRSRNLGANHVDRELFLLNGERLHNVANHATRVIVIVDGELAGITQQVGVLAQHTHAHGVEGAHPHAARTIGQKRTQTLAHLSCSLIGKGDGKNLPRTYAQIGNHVRNTKRQHARFTRASTREHQQRSLAGKNRLALRRVERIDINGVCHTNSLGKR